MLCLDKLHSCGNFPFIQLCSCPDPGPAAPVAPQSQQHSPRPVPCSCRWSGCSCSRRCIPASASCSHTACSHSVPCMSTVEGRGSHGHDAPGMLQVPPAEAPQGQGHPQAAPCSISLPVLHPRIVFFLISRIKSFHLQMHLQDLQDEHLQLLSASFQVIPKDLSFCASDTSTK